jgi:hypothetical protein
MPFDQGHRSKSFCKFLSVNIAIYGWAPSCVFVHQFRQAPSSCHHWCVRVSRGHFAENRAVNDAETFDATDAALAVEHIGFIRPHGGGANGVKAAMSVGSIKLQYLFVALCPICLVGFTHNMGL